MTVTADTGGNRDGTEPPPAILIPPNAEAGGRSSNGYMWGMPFVVYVYSASLTAHGIVEDLAYDYNITVMNYAVGGPLLHDGLI